MQKIKITVMKQTIYTDLIAQYENPISHACDMKVGQVFIANGWEKPDGLCQSAWDSMSPFVTPKLAYLNILKDFITKIVLIPPSTFYILFNLKRCYQFIDFRILCPTYWL